MNLSEQRRSAPSTPEDEDPWVDVPALSSSCDGAPKHDYYDILGINKDASPEDIRVAYISASVKNNPDETESSYPGGPLERMHRFQEIGDAYHALSDPSRRNRYMQADRPTQYFLVDKMATPEDCQQLYLQQLFDAVKYQMEHLSVKRIRMEKIVDGRDNLDNAEAKNTNSENVVGENTKSEIPVVHVELGNHLSENIELQDAAAENDDELGTPVAGNIRSIGKYSWTIAGFMSGIALGVVVGGPAGAVLLAGVGIWSGQFKDKTGKSVGESAAKSIFEQYQSLSPAEKIAFWRKLADFISLILR